MENYKKEGGARIRATVCERQIGSELIGDLSLPDYQPEIKRLLRVKATVSPPDCYVGVGGVELSGVVDYRILYAGHDGSLYCATHAQDYRFDLPLELPADFDIGEGLTCDAETVAEAVAARVSSPRRLSLRCKLRSDVRAWGTRTVEEELDAVEESSLERLFGEATCGEFFGGVSDSFVLGDEILLDSQWKDLRVVSAEGQVFVSEAMAGSGCVICRGEVCVKLLCAHDGDAGASVQLRKLPFSQTVAVDGCEVNCECAAHGVCSEVQVNVEEGRMICDVTCRLQARAQRNREIRYTRDLYSTEAEGESRYAELIMPTAVRCLNGNFSLNKTMTLEEAGVRAGMSVIDVSMTPAAATLERSGGRCILSGKCRCSLILFDGEEMSAQELELPYRYETDPIGEEITDSISTVDAISCRARVDGERISLDAELAVCAVMRGASRVLALSEMRFGDAVPKRSASYTICYPAKGDSLWSIAKRYHRSVDSLSEINALNGAPAADSPDSLSGVVYLLV